MNNESTSWSLGGNSTLPGVSKTVHRMGYGAMQLAGKGVFGPPKDEASCIAVLKHAITAGVNHIDTSDFYGPHITNQIIKKALHPYPKDILIVTKLGAKRGADASWKPAQSEADLVSGTHDNLKNLGLNALDVVNLRVGGIERPMESSIEPQMIALATLQRKGLIRHIGLSNITPNQLIQAQKIAPIVCVQNMYNVALRHDDAFIDDLGRQGIAYVPFFPLGGFSPLQSIELNEVAETLNATPMQVALAWLLHRAPNILLIPGTSSVKHLKENLNAANLKLPANALDKLNTIASKTVPTKPIH